MRSIAVLTKNEHVSFLHKKVISEQKMCLFHETFVVMDHFSDENDS